MRNLIIFFGKLFKRTRGIDLTKEPANILIVRSGGIGDVLMSTPLVRAIRERYPKAKITYFVANWSKGVLNNNPNIDEFYNYDDLVIIKRHPLGILKIIKEIKSKKFDLCFNLEKSWHWAVLTYLFKIPIRIGFDRLGEGFAHHVTVPFDGSKYELEYYLDLARVLNINVPTREMEIYLTDQEKMTVAEFAKGKIILGIAPGGADNPAQQAVIKRWPLENYIKLINTILDTKEGNIVLIGGQNDIETCNKIAESVKRQDRVINAAGKLTIKESAALMKLCNTFLTHDAGPMHMAGAVKVPLVALFGPTPNKRFAPKDSTIIYSRTDCRPCYDIYGHFKDCRKYNCMDDIKVEDVLQSVI